MCHNQDIVFVVAKHQVSGNSVINGNIAQSVDFAIQRDAGDIVEPLQLHGRPAGVPEIQLAVSVQVSDLRLFCLQQTAYRSHKIVFQFLIGVFQPVGTGRVGHHHFGGIFAVAVGDDGTGNDHMRRISARILTADGNRLQPFLHKLTQNAVHLLIRLALYWVDKFVIDILRVTAEILQHLLHLFRKQLIIGRLVFSFEVNPEIDAIL